MTSHNHGFAVDGASLPDGVRITHRNANDGVVEGLECRDVPAFSVQYHPEAAPGPHDAHPLFERFAALITDVLRAQLLELAGYRAQLVELVALEHTAKNVLIRAVKGKPAAEGVRRAYEELRDSLGLEPALERLLAA